jgi:hypothetical protein
LLDLDHLLKLRLVVARFGEMDRAQWWNTKGQLGPIGATVLTRGFPRTHHFAQARSVIAVAAHRCEEIFNPPNCVTLWGLRVDIEEEFDARWEHWLDNASEWNPLFEQVAALDGFDLVSDLKALDLVTEQDAAALQPLRRSAEGRSVQLRGTFQGTDPEATLLALAFAKGEPASLAVPWLQREDS